MPVGSGLGEGSLMDNPPSPFCPHEAGREGTLLSPLLDQEPLSYDLLCA